MVGTLVELLEKRRRDTPGQIYLHYREAGPEWKTMTWAEYGARIDRFSQALMARDVHYGDKVALLGLGSPGWFVADMSIMTIGAVTVPIYFSSSGEQIAYIVNHAEAKLLIVFGDDYGARIREHLRDMPALECIVFMNGESVPDEPLCLQVDTFLRQAQAVSKQELQARRDTLTRDDVCTYIYTSGTTGPPKAVMLTHKNCYAAVMSADESLRFLYTQATEIHVTSFVTLAHVFERIYSMLSPLVTGAMVHFGDITRALEDMREIRPTILTALPRTWEKMHEVIIAERGRMSRIKQAIFDWALTVGMQFNQAIYEKRTASHSLRLKHFIARTFVIDRILAPLGFDRARHFMTGGAVSSKEIIHFFFALGVWICQVYGQTEAMGIGTIETREKRRFGSVGIPFPGVRVKIAEDGEILLSGDVVSSGYFKEPELTAQTFRGGWLYTGDLGHMDADGYLFITGRKKDIIITSGAKNITPSKIEAALMSSPLVEHAVVAGDGKKYLTALLTVNPEAIQAFAHARGIAIKDYADLLAAPVVLEELERHVKETNAKFARVEQIKKFTILPKPLSIEAGEITSLNKIKRFMVIEKYRKEIEDMYA